MMTFEHRLLLGAFALLALAGVAEARRLVDQRIEGFNRICVYERNRMALRQRSSEAPSLKVGRGEVCPRTMPSEPQSRRAEPIPSLATLAGERRVEGQRMCSYTYLGRRYDVRVGATASCPLTPHFFDASPAPVVSN